MNTHRLTLGSRPLRVTTPNAGQFGHLGLEIAMTLAMGRDEAIGVHFRRDRPAVSEALFDIDSDEVQIVCPGAIGRRVIDAGWRIAETRDRLEARWQSLRREARQLVCLELDAYMGNRNRRVPNRLSRRMRHWRETLTDRTRRERAEAQRLLGPAYYRRRLLRVPVRTSLNAAAAIDATAVRAAVGIPRDARLVTLHVREAGFKKGREMQERKLNARDDSARNARIETYLPAVDDLVRRGYTVVRIGDPSMTPVTRQGLIDLATHPLRTARAEISCLLDSAFLICGEAGPAAVSYLTNTPSVTVNATDPISSYPVRAPSLLVLKHVIDRASGRELGLDDLLSSDYHQSIRNTTRFAYVDNSSEEIRQAVIEMLAALDGTWHETPEQRGFREAVTGAAERLRRESLYVLKWGVDEGFLGDGCLGAAFLHAHREHGTSRVAG